MSTFESRLKGDRVFKCIAKKLIEATSEGRLYLSEIGQETTLTSIHEHIRQKRDLTTEFIRFMPDCFLCWACQYEKPSYLVELKTAFTGFNYDNARPIQEMRKNISDLKRQEIVNIELGTWDNFVRIKSLGINIVLWIYVSFHLQNKWLALVPDSRLNLISYKGSQMQQSRGSFTSIANLYTRIDNRHVFALSDWLEQHYNIDKAIVDQFLEEHEQLF